MTEETRKAIADFVDWFCNTGRFSPTGHYAKVAEVMARTLVELGEKAGRSEKKDSLSTKLVHETE